MENGMISIIVPVYNAEKHLQEAIQSVLMQTYSNFELIAVNDGSKDYSLDILHQFKDQRIRIINKENTGVSDTRNVALREAKGEFVCFLDSDDCYSPRYLERMYEVAIEKGADMVVCNYTPFRGNPVFPVEKSMPVAIHNSDTLAQAGVLTSAWTKMIKTTILAENGILFDKNLTFGEDLFFCWKAFLASENIWMINDKLYGYRMTDGGATSKYHPRLYEKYKAAFTELKMFGKKVGKDDECAMDIFFATRMPSFILMTIRDNSSLCQKKKRILHILDNKTIQSVYERWNSFEKNLNPSQITFYNKCRQKKVFSLLLYGYKRNISELLKNKIRK